MAPCACVRRRWRSIVLGPLGMVLLSVVLVLLRTVACVRPVGKTVCVLVGLWTMCMLKRLIYLLLGLDGGRR